MSKPSEPQKSPFRFPHLGFWALIALLVGLAAYRGLDSGALLLLLTPMALYGLAAWAIPLGKRCALPLAMFSGGLANSLWWLSQSEVMRGTVNWLFVTAMVLVALAIFLAAFDRTRRPSLMLLASAVLGSILAYSSGDAGGPDGMIRWLQNAFGWDVRTAEIATIIVRKGVHFTYFGLIGWTAFRGALRLDAPVARAVRFALAWTLVFATYDEISQLASPVRSGSALDVLLDMTGATTMVLLASRRRSKTSTSPSP